MKESNGFISLSGKSYSEEENNNVIKSKHHNLQNRIDAEYIHVMIKKGCISTTLHV